MHAKIKIILLLCNIHIFLDITELGVKNKNLSSDTIVLLMWSQIKKNKKKMPHWQ